jgi:hypothetical protein
MKTLWRVIAIMAVLHVLIGIAGVAWLYSSDRLSRDRVAAVRELLKPTLAEETKQKAKLEEMQKAADAQADRLASLKGAGNGPETVAQRLAEERQKHEVTIRQLERAREDIESLRKNLQLAQQKIEQEHKVTLAEKASLEKRVTELEKQFNDAGFKKAVALYESLPAKQVKDMFLQMLTSGKTGDVVNFLEAMQPRKAGAILKEFKSSQEINQAVELTQRLRERGSELTKHLETSG